MQKSSETTEQVRQQFTAALDGLVAEIRNDRSILAVVLCGSLSHDTVWAKSDIDLVVVTIDDKQLKPRDLSLYADGVNVHVMPLTRTELREVVEGARHSSFMHSFFTKGRLLYTHDDTIADLLERLHVLGERDMQIELLRAATDVVPALYKAHKFMVTRGDLEYTSLWLLYAAMGLARVELISARKLTDREALPQALALNPAFFRTVYVDLLNVPKTKENVAAALGAVDGYLQERAGTLFLPVLRYLREAGEPRSATEIEEHFKRHFDIGGIVTACEYLADQGLIGKASLPVHLTRRSNVEVQETAFFDVDTGGGSGSGAWRSRAR
jgi:predicted nucleotidyltransferase